MEDIGREAGLSPGVAYRYFSSKEKIIEASSKADIARWTRFFESEKESFLGTVEAASTHLYQRLVQPRGDARQRFRLRTFTEAAGNPVVAERLKEENETVLDLVQETVLEDQRRGRINPDLDAAAVARVFMALINGLTLQSSIDPGTDLRKCKEVMMALFGGSFQLGGHQEQAERSSDRSPDATRR